MQTTPWKFIETATVATLVTAGLLGLANAQEGRATSATTKRHRFEVVFSKTGLKLYPYGPDRKALDASRLSGSATFYHPSSPRPWFDRPLRVAAATSPGLPPTSLDLNIDLSRVPTTGVKVMFQVAGLPDPAEPNATFTVPFVPGDTAELAVTKASQADERAIAAQKVCPVSREELGSMGTPIKVARGDRSVFLCCQGCVKTVLADPDKYLGRPAAKADAKPARTP
jgi:hypothetical protein